MGETFAVQPQKFYREYAWKVSTTKALPSETYPLYGMSVIFLLFRPEYFRLIEECVSQIVLHNRGVDPDFHYTKRFSINVDNLIEGMVDKARVEEAEKKAMELEAMVGTCFSICNYLLSQCLSIASPGTDAVL